MQPGATGLTPCTLGTLVRALRCDDRTTCYSGLSRQLREVASTRTEARGVWKLNVPVKAASTFVFEATIADARVTTTYSVIDFPSISGSAAELRARTPTATPAPLVIDPSSEGAFQAVIAAGFDRISDAQALDITNRTRADFRLAYTNLTADRAATQARSVALQSSFVSTAALAVSPNGASVYIAGGKALAVFSRDSVSGLLTPKQVLRHGIGGVDGLADVSDVTVSPDGKHLYTTSDQDSAIAIFSRNLTDGTLTFVRVIRDYTGFAYPKAIAVSPDGNQVYVAVVSAVQVYSRNRSTGLLTRVQDFTRDMVPALSGAVNSVAVSSDGKNVYVSNASNGSLFVFARNLTSGVLTHAATLQDGVGGVDGLGGVEHVRLSPDDKFVYAAGPGDRAIAIFQRLQPAGLLSFAGAQPLGTSVRRLALSPDGSILYAGASGKLQVLARDARSGALTPGTSFTAIVGVQSPLNEPLVSSLGDLCTLGTEGICGEVSVAVSPDGAHIYAGGTHDGGVAAFQRSGLSASFLGVGRAYFSRRPGLRSPQKVSVSPDGKNLYVASADDSTIAVLQRGVGDHFTYLEAQRNGANGVDGLGGVTSLDVSPDGRHVYATSLVADAVAAFARNQTTGALTFVGVWKSGQAGVSGLNGVRAVAISADGKHVYVASSLDDAVAVFSRNATTGALTFVEAEFDGGAVNGLDGAESVSVSRDGSNVYVVGRDHALAAFARDASTGGLTFSSAISTLPGTGPVSLFRPGAVAVSPDNLHLYAAGNPPSFTGFTRSLTLIDRQDGRGAMNSVAVAPDGTAVFGTEYFKFLLLAFTRNTSTGQLSAPQEIYDGVNGVDGLMGANSVAVSPDGRLVFVTGGLDDAVAVFTRNTTTNQLTFLEVLRE